MLIIFGRDIYQLYTSCLWGYISHVPCFWLNHGLPQLFLVKTWLASAVLGLILVCLCYSWFNLGLPWLFSFCLGYSPRFNLSLSWLWLVILGLILVCLDYSRYVSVILGLISVCLEYSWYVSVILGLISVCLDCSRYVSVILGLILVCQYVSILSLGLSRLFSVCQEFCQIKKIYRSNPTKTRLNLTKTQLNLIKSYYQFSLLGSRFFSVKSCFFQGLGYRLNLGFSRFVFLWG